MFNESKPKAFVKPAGLKPPDIDREHIELRRRKRGNLLNEGTSKAMASAFRDDVHPAYTTSAAEAGVRLQIQPGR